MFSSSPSIGSVFSETGLAKLAALKEQLQAFKLKLYPQKERSEYSDQMLNNVIQVITMLMTNNSISYWKKDANREHLENLLTVLDGGKGTYVPEVFNQQSYELANILLEAIKTLQLDKDLHGATSLALEALVGKPDNLLLTIRQNLEHKLYFYNLLLTNDEEATLRKKVSVENRERYDQMMEQAKSAEVCRGEDFRSSYRNECEIMRQSLTALPHYLALANARTFVNASQPYRFESAEVVSKGNRSTCIRELLSDERALAEQMVKMGVDPILDLHVFYRESYSKEAGDALQAKFTTLVAELTRFLEEYESGKHLMQGGFFTGLARKAKGVNPDKLACVKSLGSKVSACMREDQPSSYKSFDIFQFLLDAICQNERICQTQKISLGELSKLFNRYAQSFFLLTYKEVSEVNDIELFDSVCRNLKRMGITEEQYQAILEKDKANVSPRPQ